MSADRVIEQIQEINTPQYMQKSTPKYDVSIKNINEDFDNYIRTTNVDDDVKNSNHYETDSVDNENKIKDDTYLLKANFEAETFSSNIIYGAKIEALEKQLQQVLLENHNLRKQMSKMKNMVGSLVRIVK